jgi:hypothetical protein
MASVPTKHIEKNKDDIIYIRESESKVGQHSTIQPITCNEAQEKQKHSEKNMMCVLSNNIIIDDYTITHIGTENTWGKVICTQPLPHDRVSYFVINIDLLPSARGMCGITSNPFPQYPYYADNTFYGWYSPHHIFRAGRSFYACNWPGWENKDEVVVRYNPLDSSLQMFHYRLDRIFGMYYLPDIPFYFDIALYDIGSCVRVRTTNECGTQTIPWD